MNKTLTTLTLLLTLAGVAVGCTAQGEKGPVPDLTTGKADGELEVVEHEGFALGNEVEAELSPNVGHAWKFEVSDEAVVSFQTSSEANVDTVVYLTDAEGNELAVDDDGGDGYLSKLEAAVDAGTYTVTVTGYDNAETGPFGMTSGCEGAGCGEGGTDPGDPEPQPADDPWAGAKDVHTMHVEFTDATPIPESFTRAEGVSPLSLSGPEWWQRWSGGATQSFSWSEGTDYGKRCGQASAIRLQAIWEYAEEDDEGNVTHPGREAFEALLDGSGWGGTMYNWTEDVSEGGYPVFDPASMWAWRTGAVKWINIVRPDGSCDLPTLDLVQRFSETCLEQASHEDGAIEGCQASGR